MKKFEIPCLWKMYGYVKVEAETLQKAIKEAEGPNCPIPLPEDSWYLEDSFEVDVEAIGEVLSEASEGKFVIPK